MRKTKVRKSRAAPTLRERAEKELSKRGGQPDMGTRANAVRLLHELSVHQIELEMQNDELVQTQGDLQASYDELYNFAPVGYLTLDAGGTVHRANATAARMLGINRADLPGRKFGPCVAAEFRTAYGSFLKKVFKSARNESCVVTVAKRGGTPVHVHIQAERLKSAELCRAVLTDVTSTLEAEKNMRQSHDRLTLALAAAGMGAWEWDYAANEIFWSPECREIVGIDRLCVKLAALRDVICPDDLAAALGSFQRALAGRTAVSAEFRITRPNGEPAWLLVRGEAKYGAGGTPSRAYGIVQDITDRQKFEETLQHARADSGLLLRELHHRAGNNLRATITMVELCAREAPDRRTRDNLRDLQQRIRAMALVHDSLSRTSNLELLDFGGYLKALAEQIAAALSTGPDIRMEVDTDDVMLGMEPAIACGAIVSELLTNAFKYAFRSGARARRTDRRDCVRISMRRSASARSGPGRHAAAYTLSVADNGVGLPADTDPRTASTLGMTLVRMLAGEIGARFDVDRSAGTAYKFKFSVPAQARPAAGRL